MAAILAAAIMMSCADRPSGDATEDDVVPSAESAIPERVDARCVLPSDLGSSCNRCRTLLESLIRAFGLRVLPFGLLPRSASQCRFRFARSVVLWASSLIVVEDVEEQEDRYSSQIRLAKPSIL
jgi:hypothetical protein